MSLLSFSLDGTNLLDLAGAPGLSFCHSLATAFPATLTLGDTCTRIGSTLTNSGFHCAPTAWTLIRCGAMSISCGSERDPTIDNADQLGPDADQLGRDLGAGGSRAGDARPPLDLVERRLEQVDLGHRVDVGGDELALDRRGQVGRGVEDLHGRRGAVGGGDGGGLGDVLEHRVAELQVGGRRGERVAQRHGGGGVDGGAQPVEALVAWQRRLRQVEQVRVGLERVVLPPRVDVGGLDVRGGEGGAVLGDLGGSGEREGEEERKRRSW